jgi:hypothetical protein
MDRMEMNNILEGLPPVEIIRQDRFTGAHALFLSCDYGYFELYGKALVRSIAANYERAQVRIHLMDAGPQQTEGISAFLRDLPLAIVFSGEKTAYLGHFDWNAKLYYHAVRFIRLFQAISADARTYWLFDVDALVRRDLSETLGQIADCDVALQARAHILMPWHKFTAGLVGIAPSPVGLRYLKLVAATIAALKQQDRLRWGIDQFVLYAAFVYLAGHGTGPKLRPLDNRSKDDGVYGYDKTSPIWMQHGRHKKNVFNMEAADDENDATDEPDYAKELRRYL